MKTYQLKNSQPFHVKTDVVELHEQLLMLIDKLNVTDENTEDYKVLYSHMTECRTELGVKSARILLDLLKHDFIEVEDNL